MTNEIEQPDIPDRQLFKTGSEPRVSYSREIGEATITHTIFGKAKVRITRKYDNLRRAMWLTATAVAAVVGWKAWLVFQPAEPLASADSLSSVQERQPEVVQERQPEVVVPPVLAVSAPMVESRPVAVPVQQVARQAVPVPGSAPHPAPAVKAQVPVSAVPVVQHSAPMSRPQAMPLPLSAVAAATPAAKPLPPRPVMQGQSAVPAVVPRATPPLVHSAASSPAAAPLASPLAREVVTAPVSAPLAAPVR